MNFTAVKNAKDLQLAGVSIDSEWRDKELVSVTITDANGRVVKIAKQDYSLRAYVPAPPEKKTVHVVTGKVRGIGTEVREVFDHAYEANSRRGELEAIDVLVDAAVITEDVEIPF